MIPPIPLDQFFHELKFQETHEEFFRQTRQLFPKLEDQAACITDCEAGIREAIKEIFPKLPLLRCWNHFFESTERWIRGHGG